MGQSDLAAEFEAMADDFESGRTVSLNLYQRSYTMSFNVTDDPATARSAVLRLNGTAGNGNLDMTLNGQPMTNEIQLSIAMQKTFAQLPPGASYTLVVRRAGQTQQLTLRSAPRPLWFRSSALRSP